MVNVHDSVADADEEDDDEAAASQVKMLKSEAGELQKISNSSDGSEGGKNCVACF